MYGESALLFPGFADDQDGARCGQTDGSGVEPGIVSRYGGIVYEGTVVSDDRYAESVPE
ncbi:hypothetical protein D3C74_486210 [compost metagenome]